MSPRSWTDRLTRPRNLLIVAVAVSVGLALLPARRTEPLKVALATALRPGQAAAVWLREGGARTLEWARNWQSTAARLAQSERRREELEIETQRLAIELAIERGRASSLEEQAGAAGENRLLVARYVPVRVLGQQARAFLARRHLLDAGSRAGVEADQLVLDLGPGLIDRGSDAPFTAGQLVLSQGRVWGKIVSVGPLTSTVRTLTEPGYRDLVCVGARHPAADSSPAGPQGILEGTGEPLARIRLVEVTEPVAVGDPVYSVSAKGVLAEPLLCGHVARLQRPIGSAHWEIWVQPALASKQPQQVVVLSAELNPRRVAKLGSAPKAR